MCNISEHTYKKIAARSYGGEVAKDLFYFWKQINKKFYGGELPTPLITFEIMPYGKCIGLTTADRGHIRLKKPPKGTRIVVDADVVAVLLHEVIHYARPYYEAQALAATTLEAVKGADKTSHNDLYWLTEINRIHLQATGEHLGANFNKVIQGKRVSLGSLRRDQVARWPYSINAQHTIYNYLLT